MNLEPKGHEIVFRLTLCPEWGGNEGERVLDFSGPSSAVLSPFCRLLRSVEAGGYPESDWPGQDLSRLEAIEQRLGLS